MPSETVLRMRITEAVREAERANANRDLRAYNRAKAKYAKADAWLTKLEKERNAKAINELEAKARNGVLSPAAIQRSGIPLEVLWARGWGAIADKPGLHRTNERKSAGEKAGEVQSHDDTAEPDGKNPEHESGGECA